VTTNRRQERDRGQDIKGCRASGVNSRRIRAAGLQDSGVNSRRIRAAGLQE